MPILHRMLTNFSKEFSFAVQTIKLKCLQFKKNMVAFVLTSLKRKRVSIPLNDT